MQLEPLPLPAGRARATFGLRFQVDRSLDFSQVAVVEFILLGPFKDGPIPTAQQRCMVTLFDGTRTEVVMP